MFIVIAHPSKTYCHNPHLEFRALFRDTTAMMTELQEELFGKNRHTAPMIE
jgi:hypothetical protein